MRKVERAELLDFASYGDRREHERAAVMAIKEPRRIHVGDCLTFLFENTDTIRYQIQEMMRAERIVREADIAHELATYNGLLGDEGELGCTLLIEIDDVQERDTKLRAWRDLPAHLYIRCEEGRRVGARFDPAQVGDEKLSSVQYLKFPVGDGVPLAIGCDLPALVCETPLNQVQRRALIEDLRPATARS